MRIYGKVYDLSLSIVDLKNDPMECSSEDYDQCIQTKTCNLMKNSTLFPFCNTKDLIERDEKGQVEATEVFQRYKRHFFSKEVRRDKCNIPCIFSTPSLKTVSEEIKANEGAYFHKKDKTWKGSAI